MKVKEFEIYRGKRQHGMTTRQHVANMFQKDPWFAKQLIDTVYAINYEETFLSYVERFDEFLAKEEKYNWPMQGPTEGNYPLEAAWADVSGTTPLSTVTYVGRNNSFFYLDFKDKYFGPGQIIVGRYPDKYRIVIKSEREIGGGWRYEAQLVGPSSAWIPAEELTKGRRFYPDGGLTQETHSYEGYGVNHRSPFTLTNRTTQFRMQETVPGNMFKEGKNNSEVYKFSFVADDGKVNTVWIDHLTHQFLLKSRIEAAKTYYHAKSNENSDGTIGNRGALNKQPEPSGSGFEEMTMSTNRHPYRPDRFSLTQLRDIILSSAEGKFDVMNTDITIGAGLRGLSMLKEMVQKEPNINNYLFGKDTSGSSIQRSGKNNNDIFLSFGNIVGYADIFNIRVNFMHLPHKDNPYRNQVMHPLGGPASAYELEIMDFGGNGNTEGNIQRVRVEGQDPVFAVVPGMRSGIQEGSSGLVGAKEISTPVDATTFHMMDWGGFVIWKPDNIMKLFPKVKY